MARILVTDGDERSALAVVRSLGRVGHEVIVGASEYASLAGASRLASGRVRLADPTTEEEQFVITVANAVKAHDVDMVVPLTDASVMALLVHADDIRPAILPLASSETFRRVSDKAVVAAAAATLGIAVPRHVRVDRRTELVEVLQSDRVNYPIVLKPARSVAGAGAQRARHGVVHALDPANGLRWAATLPDGAFPLLVQERITGYGIGVFLLLWRGQLLAAFAHRRLREKPPSGGVSVLCESVRLTPDMLERSRSLLEHFGWSGVAMVEYKRDSSSGRDVLMEINGRFWGSLQLAIDAGVDFPTILADAALAVPHRVHHPTSYRIGQRSRWWWGDVDHLLARIVSSRRALALPSDAPSLLRTILSFLSTTLTATKDQVLRLNDPFPFVHETKRWLRGILET